MPRRYLYILVIVTTLISCNDRHNEDDKNIPDRYLSANSTLNNQATTKLVSIIQEYFYLKNAFVGSNEKQVNIAAKKLNDACQDFNKSLLNDTMGYAETNNQVDTILLYTEQIMAINDKSTELKRKPFLQVSNALYILINEYKLRGIRIYQQYCPMAFNDNGAYWLSDSKEILNPYFGKKMLECGEVVNIIE